MLNVVFLCTVLGTPRAHGVPATPESQLAKNPNTEMVRILGHKACLGFVTCLGFLP